VTHLRWKHVLLDQASSQYSYNLDLLFWGKPGDGCLQHTTDSCVIDGNEAGVVEECDGAHNELAVHAIRDTAVAGNAVPKIFDLESTLQARSKETAERCDQGCKRGEDKNMEVKRFEGVRVADRRETRGNKGNDIGLLGEYRVHSAFQTREKICAKVLHNVS
jgi:hypothetical protein